jgi:hypothetical protein
MYNFNIHNILEVVAHQDTHPSIIKMLNSQIGFFFKNDIQKLNLPKIKIFPYIYKKNYQNFITPHDVFYNDMGIVDNFLDLKEKNFFIKKDISDIIICADYANFTIATYIQIILSLNKSSFIHAAAFQTRAKGINIITGSGGIGKTLLLGYASRDLNLKYLGDDLIILNANKICHSFPRDFVLKKYHKESYFDTFKKEKLSTINFYLIKKIILENFPFVGFLKKILKKTKLYYSLTDLLSPKTFLGTVSPEKIFGKDMSLDSGLINKLIYLDRVTGDDFVISKIDYETAVNRIFSVVHYELKDSIPVLLSIGSFNIINLGKYYSDVIDILKKSLNNSSLIQIKIPQKANPNSIIDFFKKNNLFD